MRKIVILLLVIFINGCASASGPLFSKVASIPSGKAVIYFYREDTPILSGVGSYFYIDEKEVSKLSPNGYSAHLVDIGSHKVQMSWNCSLGACLAASSLKNKPERELSLEEGQSAYYKLVIDGAFFGDEINWGFSRIDERRAIKELATARAQK